VESAIAVAVDLGGYHAARQAAVKGLGLAFEPKK
jgi:hypothetical protein